MPRHQVRRQPQAVMDAPITPETGVSVSLKQVWAIVATIFVAAVGYVALYTGQATTSKDVTEIKTSLAQAAAATAAALTTQDEKRTSLGKEFLASNSLIVKSLGELTTLTAVQQERQKATDEKLEKVLGQIGAALAVPGQRK